MLEAVKNRNYQKVKFLLEDSSIDPNINEGEIILHACSNGDLEMAKLLLKDERINPGNFENNCIYYAAINNHIEVVKLLLQDVRVDPSFNNNLLIERIVYPSSGSILMEHLDGSIKTQHLDVSIKTEHLDVSIKTEHLEDSVKTEHINIFKLILSDPRVNPSTNNNGPIRWASAYGNIDIVKLLLNDKRVDPSDDNNFAINYASERMHTETVKLLMQDPRVDWRNINKKMKLQFIIEKSNELKKYFTQIFIILKFISKNFYIPREILRKIVYQSYFFTLDVNKFEIPDLNTIVLTNFLKIGHTAPLSQIRTKIIEKFKE